MAQSKGSQKSTDAVISNDPLGTKFFEGNPKGAEAWRQLIANGQYRLAQAQDFQLSNAARRRLLYIFGEDWQSRVFNPYTGGEINHDKYYHDSAFIVVDKTRNDPKRFGLIIFNEQEGGSPHKTYWLYKERDLSTTVFGWASSGLHLEEFNEAGEFALCYVKWDAARQEYSCDPLPKQLESKRWNSKHFPEMLIPHTLRHCNEC
jgi:hypothetical protein